MSAWANGLSKSFHTIQLANGLSKSAMSLSEFIVSVSRNGAFAALRAQVHLFAASFAISRADVCSAVFLSDTRSTRGMSGWVREGSQALDFRHQLNSRICIKIGRSGSGRPRGARAPLDRPGPPRKSSCTEKQHRRASLRPCRTEMQAVRYVPSANALRQVGSLSAWWLRQAQTLGHPGNLFAKVVLIIRDLGVGPLPAAAVALSNRDSYDLQPSAPALQ